MKTEVLLECLCPSYKLPTLGRVLRRGEIISLDAAQTDSSVELQKAIRMGALSEKRIRRCEEVKEPQPVIPPWLAPKPEQPLYSTEPPKKVEIVKELIPTSLEELRVVVDDVITPKLDALEKNLISEVKGMFQTFVELIPAPQIIHTSNGDPTPIKTQEEELPIFIPSGLTSQINASSSVQVKEETNKDANVEDALASLRELKK